MNTSFVKIDVGLRAHQNKGGISQMDKSSLAHSKWNCKCHIVCAPKCRKQIIYGKIKVDIRQILMKLCEHRGVEILEVSTCSDHYIYACKYTPKIKCVAIYGIFKRKKFINYIR